MWSNILNWTLEFVSKLGEFANWLFSPITMADYIASHVGLVGRALDAGSGGNAYFDAIMAGLHAVFEERADWLYNIQFTPISIISVTGLIFCVLFSVLNKLNFFG